MIEKNKNNLTIVVIILIILVLGLGGFIIYDKVLNDENANDYSLNILKSDISYCDINQDSTCKDIVYTIKTNTMNSSFIKAENGFILYDDNVLKIYNSNTNEIIKTDLENKYSSYSFYFNNDGNKIIGLICKKNEKTTYYNLITNKKMYENAYKHLYSIDENFMHADGFLLNVNKEEIIISSKNVAAGYDIKYYADGYYILEFDSFVNSSSVSIYTDSKQNLASNIDINKYYFDDSGNLFVVSDNIIKQYNIDGSLISSKKYSNIMGLKDGFVVYLDNNNLYLGNIENNKNQMITIWKDSYYYDEYSSGYYDREKLDSMDEMTKSEGFYVVISYKNQDANGNYGIEYCYNVETNEFKTYNITEPLGGRAKPVLYLYPSEQVKVKVKFQHPEYLTTTYPKYDAGWEVLANPNGDLYDNNNKYYYALYWDETRYNEVNFDEGFYVTKENAINFLEEKLEIIGLNDRERNEFIMYWLPILEKNEKSLVYFELTEERENTNKLIIEPSPDSLLRVSIHIKKVNNYIKIKEQKLKTFERYGFTAVEWGGMTY